jgi:predicted aspartyl protease
LYGLNKTVWKPGLIVAAASALLLGGEARLFAADYYSAAVTMMQRRDFKSALAYLGAAYRSDPNNAEIARMMSTCYANLRDATNAKKWSDYYNSVVRAQSHAQPSSAASASPISAQNNPYTAIRGGNSSDLARLPDQCRVPFEKEQRVLFINAYINNRPIRMIFDTGAEIVAIGKNHLREMQLPAPEGKPIGMASGVGSTGGVAVWDMPMSVKVGTIDRQNFHVAVQETMPTPPLLGQSFFHDFEYTIDYSNPEKDRGMILFTKKGSSYATAKGSGQSGYSVPFCQDGNNLVVNVDVNGHMYPMYFDTGASTCTFSEKQLKDLNIRIPEEAAYEQHVGIGGTTMGRGFTVPRMRLGPIEKINMPISVTQSSNMLHPLLGQSFYGDWQYTIDNDAHVIRFLRR